MSQPNFIFYQMGSLQMAQCRTCGLDSVAPPDLRRGEQWAPRCHCPVQLRPLVEVMTGPPNWCETKADEMMGPFKVLRS